MKLERFLTVTVVGLQSLAMAFSIIEESIFRTMTLAQGRISKCDTDNNPCGQDHSCVRGICIPKGMEGTTMLTDPVEIRRALLAAVIEARQHNKTVPETLGKAENLCSTYKLEKKIDYEQGYRFSFYHGEDTDILVIKGTTTKQEVKNDLQRTQVRCDISAHCGEVHAGFNTVFETIKPAVDELIKKLETKKLVVIGHSLVYNKTCDFM